METTSNQLFKAFSDETRLRIPNLLMLRDHLAGIQLKSKPDHVNAMTSFEDPFYQKIVAHLPPGARPHDDITSLDVRAGKAVK
jgi:hypothetical protein